MRGSLTLVVWNSLGACSATIRAATWGAGGVCPRSAHAIAVVGHYTRHLGPQVEVVSRVFTHSKDDGDIVVIVPSPAGLVSGGDFALDSVCPAHREVTAKLVTVPPLWLLLLEGDVDIQSCKTTYSHQSR